MSMLLSIVYFDMLLLILPVCSRLSSICLAETIWLANSKRQIGKCVDNNKNYLLKTSCQVQRKAS